jgi:hypothetical protein
MISFKLEEREKEKREKGVSVTDTTFEGARNIFPFTF